MKRPERHIRLRSSARSDRGRVRQNNEDNIQLWAEDYNLLAVVADGMGGAVAGEEASRIAVETILDRLSGGHYRKPEDYEHYDAEELAELLDDAIKEANHNIIAKVHTKPELKGMGTTVTMAFARQNDVILAHVGDSRAYYVDGSDGTINQLTVDHTFVQALVESGNLSKEDAADHPMANVLYRALGQAEDLIVDTMRDVRLFVGDRMVLCSDGLTLHVTPEEIADIALTHDEPNDISEQLIEMALSRGGKDNVSVIVIVVEQMVGEAVDENTDEFVAFGDWDENNETIPMNPDILNITRKKKSSNNNNNHSSKPNTNPPTDSQHHRAYGEGRDAFEPLQ